MNPIGPDRARQDELSFRVGVFDTIPDADRAVHALLNGGFTKEQITVVCSDKYKEHFFKAYEHQDPAGSTTVEKAAWGGAIGASLGGLATLAGVVATGGIGLLFGGAILAGMGGVTGGLIGAMMSRGVEKELANYYDQSVVAGKILVAAEDHSPAEPERLALAEKLLSEAGANPIPLAEG
jgi:hypothetical protein